MTVQYREKRNANGSQLLWAIVDAAGVVLSWHLTRDDAAELVVSMRKASCL